MKLKSYDAVSLSTIRETFVAFGGTEEAFDSFVRTVLEYAYTWGDAAHTLCSLEGFVENMAGDSETEWPSAAWSRLYETLKKLTERETPVYVDLET